MNQIADHGKKETRSLGKVSAVVLLAMFLILVMGIKMEGNMTTDIMLHFQNILPTEITEIASLQPLREARLGDGCYHVFLDVGANIGVHGRFLLEPHKYPETRKAVDFFEQRYGANRSNEDYCVFEIEANLKHWPRLHNVSTAYREMGWRFHVVEAAASDFDGTMTFYHQNDVRQSEWGFGVMDRPVKDTNATSVQVPTIRLSKWLEHEIFERRIPNVPPSGRSYEKPILGMKMDIEGSEYIVLPDMAMSGAFCQLDFVFGELHPVFAPLDFEGQRVSLKTLGEVKTFHTSMQQMFRGSRNCHTDFVLMDDESYLNDGQPLPTKEEKS